MAAPQGTLRPWVSPGNYPQAPGAARRHKATTRQPQGSHTAETMQPQCATRQPQGATRRRRHKAALPQGGAAGVILGPRAILGPYWALGHLGAAWSLWHIPELDVLHCFLFYMLVWFLEPVSEPSSDHGHLGAHLMGSSRGHLGPCWGILGPSWGILVSCWDHLGAYWRDLGPLGEYWSHRAILEPSQSL